MYIHDIVAIYVWCAWWWLQMVAVHGVCTWYSGCMVWQWAHVVVVAMVVVVATWYSGCMVWRWWVHVINQRITLLAHKQTHTHTQVYIYIFITGHSQNGP